ncbi:tetratricopeptide repeat protein [Eleftheria terrae]|uniref:tetratricopeptide repeat protein n=1 Tax=Eleftheria terrae TaxID=1597781 RepID=UPI00263B467E|nr:tetratricopeptide repeat protein [Eleftheria terrae]WKB53294.1 tetratricopeptide repeat protein [Eleftheria terrae]
MRREYVAMEKALREFIEQPDDPVLVLCGTDPDLLFPLKALQEMDRQAPTPVFLVFPFPCTGAADYLDQALKAVAAQIDAANVLRSQEGAPPWAALPLLCLDARQAPAQRLLAAVKHVREVVDRQLDIVWGLLPNEIGDAEGYRDLVSPLLDGWQPWMQGQRFILRDRRDTPFVLAGRERLDGVLKFRVDFSAEKAADSLVREVHEARLPLPQRMQALMQLAAFDLAYQRFDGAHEKYALLYDYHRQQGDAVGQALALGGAGDVASRLGRHEEAKQRYQQALAVAGPVKNLSVMLNLLMAAGASCLQLGQYAEAEGYYELASRSAGKLLFSNAKIEAMEQQGVALAAQGRPVEAARLWIDAKGLCEQFGCTDPHRALLGRLRGLYASLQMEPEVKACDEELATLDRGAGAVPGEASPPGLDHPATPASA